MTQQYRQAQENIQYIQFTKDLVQPQFAQGSY